VRCQGHRGSGDMAPKSSKRGALSSDVSDELNKLAAEAATGRGAGRKAPRDAGPASKSGVHTAHDNTPAAQSTDVFVAGLHKDASVADLEEAFGDAGPVKLAKILKGGRGMLSFVLAADASRCVAEMQGTPVRGAAVSISLGAPSGEGGGSAADSERRGEPRGNTADESDAAGMAAAAAKPVKPGVKLNTRLFRIIVRNLPFGVKEAAVRGAFARFGELEEVHLPTKPGRNGQPEGRGFAFLQFATKKEAAECVETGNGMEMLGRPVAVDWAVAKEVYAEVAKPTKKQEREAREEERKKKLEAQRAEEAEERKKRKAGEEVDGAKGKKSKGDKDQGAEEVGIGGDINTTVFVRNIPLESSEQELAGVMRPFGKIIFCRMVMDKTTGKHRGSAFVKYAELSAARAAVDAGAAFTGSEDWEQIQRKQDRKKSSSAFLRGTIQDEFQSTLQMHGRHLFVAFAVDRQTSEKLVAQEKEKIDRRCAVPGRPRPMLAPAAPARCSRALPAEP
jgi:nucleolar protein 4